MASALAWADGCSTEFGRLLVYAPLKNRLGFSRIRVAYTAGEAIGPDLFSFYRSLGMNLKQFYGQTESFLYLTAQADGEIRPDTVGGVLPEVEIGSRKTVRYSSSRPGSSSRISGMMSGPPRP